MKMINNLLLLYKKIALLVLILLTCKLNAQDKEFWFAAPDISEQESRDTTTTMQVYVYDIQDDHAQALKETPVTIDVLANDNFSGCSTPTLNVPSSTGRGSITVQGGKLKYTPKADALGIDDFTYTVTCGSNTSGAATVRVYIAEKPDNISSANCYVLPEETSWSIKETTLNSAEQVYNYAPLLVGDIDNDGTIEILAHKESSSIAYSYASPGIKIFYYNTSTKKVELKSEFLFSTSGGSNSATFGAIAMARYNNTGYIVVAGVDKYIYAYNVSGERIWRSDQTYDTNGYGTLLGIADFNNDGDPEVYTGNQIFSLVTGKRLCDGGTTNSSGVLVSATGHSTVAADIDGDGTLELVAGVNIYKVDITSNDGTAGNSISLMPGMQLTQTLPANAAKDGATQVVDIDNDGKLEVVVMSLDSNRAVAYVWKPLPNNQSYIMGSYLVPATNVQYYSIPMLGNIDDSEYPEIVFITNGSVFYMYALQFNPTATVGSQISLKWRLTHTDRSGCTGATLFDFNQDQRNEIVYRDETTLRIIDGSIDPSVPANNGIKATFTNVGSGTLREYPVIADVDGDGQAEIVVTGGSGVVQNGYLRVFKTNGSPWAPARKVWNQYGYSAVNVNENLTIPKYPLSPAAKFPNGKRVFNAFLQQATVISKEGDMVFLAPEAQLNGTPSYTWRSDNNTLEIKIKVKNVGDADLVAPVYATVYKNSVLPANKLATGSCATNIAPNATGEITMTIPSISTKLPITNIIVRINDNDGAYEWQKQCRNDDNLNDRPLATMPRAVNDTIRVRSNILHTDNDITGNDTYSCSPSDLLVSIVPPISTNAATASINAGKKLDYQSKVGFNGEDKIYYKIQCSGSEDASIAIAHMVIYKPVRVVIVSGLDKADESGTPKAKLRFEFTDNVTHTKKVEVSYSITPDGESEVQSPAPPTPYKVVIPIGQRSVEVELTAKQNQVVQGNRDIAVTITEVKELP